MGNLELTQAVTKEGNKVVPVDESRQATFGEADEFIDNFGNSLH